MKRSKFSEEQINLRAAPGGSRYTTGRCVPTAGVQ